MAQIFSTQVHDIYTATVMRSTANLAPPRPQNAESSPVNCSTNAVGPVETVKLAGYLHPQDVPAIPNTVVVLAAICVRPLRTNRSTRLTDGGCNQCNERILNRARAEIEALRLGLQHQEGVFVRATNNGFQIPRPGPFAEKLRSTI